MLNGTCDALPEKRRDYRVAMSFKRCTPPSGSRHSRATQLTSRDHLVEALQASYFWNALHMARYHQAARIGSIEAHFFGHVKRNFSVGYVARRAWSHIKPTDGQHQVRLTSRYSFSGNTNFSLSLLALRASERELDPVAKVFQIADRLRG